MQLVQTEGTSCPSNIIILHCDDHECIPTPPHPSPYIMISKMFVPVVLLALLGLGFVGLCEAQGKCDVSVVPAVQNFSLESFTEGTWYAHSQFNRNEAQESFVRCYKHVFEKESNTSNYLYNETAIYIEDGELTGTTMLLEPLEPESVWKLTYAVIPVNLAGVVVHTDYSTFALVYQCVEQTGEELIFVLTRSPTPEESLTTLLESIVVGHGFPKENGVQYDNSNCL